jgi:DHA1 family multidrug resistance protein-like MFS transporter
VIPLLSVHYVAGLGWAAASIGLVLAVRQFVQQGFTAVGGVLADRWGPKGLITAGMLIRAVGFAAMAFADRYAWLMAASIVAALGGALFESPRAAAIAALTRPDERPRYFALAGTAGGLGITVGTQVGALLLRVDFAVVSLAAASCFALIGG